MPCVGMRAALGLLCRPRPGARRLLPDSWLLRPAACCRGAWRCAGRQACTRADHSDRSRGRRRCADPRSLTAARLKQLATGARHPCSLLRCPAAQPLLRRVPPVRHWLAAGWPPNPPRGTPADENHSHVVPRSMPMAGASFAILLLCGGALAGGLGLREGCWSVTVRVRQLVAQMFARQNGRGSGMQG